MRTFLASSLAVMLMLCVGCNKERDEADDCPNGTCSRAKSKVSCSGGSCSIKRSSPEIKDLQINVETKDLKVENKNGRKYYDGALVIKRGETPPSGVVYVFEDDLEKCKQCVGFKCEAPQLAK